MTEEQTDDKIEPMLVLCHTFFSDAFRNFPLFGIENTVEAYLRWKSATFVARFIIEKQSELPEGQYVSITSKRIFDEFIEQFKLKETVARRWETLQILSNMIHRIETPSINELNVDDSLIAICDILYSRSKYNPVILVTNAPRKITEHAIKFYEESVKPKKFKESDIPFLIYDTSQTEVLLRERFKDLCNIVNGRIED